MCKLFLLLTFMGCFLPLVLTICEPSCKGKDPGDHVEDPKNCTKYYICMPGHIPTQSSLPCDPGNIFDPDLGICSPGNTCTASCVPPDCHLTCTEQVDLISDPYDCSVYWVCLAGQVVGDSKRCEADAPYFNGKFCVNDKSQCCTELCRPYCYEGVYQAPDPTNCTAFYICEEEGVPSEDVHFSCKDNEIFDITLGRCTPDAQCRPLCDDGTGNIVSPEPPGSSTTTPLTSTTTTTNVSGGCKDSMTCPGGGFYAQCTTCQSGYFVCKGVGQQGILEMCPDGKVFNTNPSAPLCVLPEQCPYYP
ncbi:uncharacterized protein LOC123500404 [Portunus trituberculatus]|uniref:uncharacterized protein LOC123500404 n=1 Tax=Portunus trituberculatus TaxID=210409 RepID=UPI001E1D1185|nr:uncharacterized protein LOC123500404 [Portunus trituberculatus]